MIVGHKLHAHLGFREVKTMMLWCFIVIFMQLKLNINKYIGLTSLRILNKDNIGACRQVLELGLVLYKISGSVGIETRKVRCCSTCNIHLKRTIFAVEANLIHYIDRLYHNWSRLVNNELER